jgi:hypothetical protein
MAKKKGTKKRKKTEERTKTGRGQIAAPAMQRPGSAEPI